MNRPQVSWLLLLILCLAALLAYSNSFHNSFQFDDGICIVDNPAIKDIRDLRAIWNYWPTRFLTDLSIALNYRFNGLDVFGYHVFNFLVHLGSGLLLWGVVLLTLRTPAMKRDLLCAHGRSVAFFSAALFLLHPIQTQPVNYIIQRATLLAAFFYLASAALFAKARIKQQEQPDSGVAKTCLIGSFVAGVAAMFSKEMAISLPVMLWVYESYFLRAKKGIGWKLATASLLLFAVIPLTMLATHSVNFQEMKRANEIDPGISVGHYFLTQQRVIVTYLRLLLLPLRQNLDYAYPVSRSIMELPTLLSFFLLLLLLFLGAKLFRKHRLLSFGIFWFFIALAPESSVIPIKDVIVEHRLYLPMAGFALFVAGGLFRLARGKDIWLMGTILSVLAVCYGIATHERNKVWRDELTMWGNAVSQAETKARPYKNRGALYEAKGELDKALADYSAAIELDPNYAGAYCGRGNVYQRKGELDKALLDLDKALAISPTYTKAYIIRGDTYQAKGDPVRAVADYTMALKLEPNDAAIYNNRGNAYRNKGDFDLALADYKKAIALDPAYADVYNSLGNLYQAKGDPDLAIVQYNKALDRKTGHPANCYNNRGNAFRKKGDMARAIADYTKALEIDPRHAEAYGNRGSVYYFEGRFDEAAADYSKAIELNPKNTTAYNNRGNIYQKKGALDLALADYGKALEIDPRYTNTYINRGNLYQVKNELDLAIADYSKAIAIDPGQAKTYYNRAVAYFKKGDPAKSREDARHAESLGYKVPEGFLEESRKTADSLPR